MYPQVFIPQPPAFFFVFQFLALFSKWWYFREPYFWHFFYKSGLNHFLGRSKKGEKLDLVAVIIKKKT